MKYLLITLIVQDGENRHDHRILHVTKGQNIEFVAQWYASHFYGDNAELNHDTGFWEFQAGCIAVELYSVVELSEFEYKLMQRIFDNQPKPRNYFEVVQAGSVKPVREKKFRFMPGKMVTYSCIRMQTNSDSLLMSTGRMTILIQ